jgi:hypothetical protein
VVGHGPNGTPTPRPGLEQRRVQPCMLGACSTTRGAQEHRRRPRSPR